MRQFKTSLIPTSIAIIALAGAVAIHSTAGWTTADDEAPVKAEKKAPVLERAKQWLADRKDSGLVLVEKDPWASFAIRPVRGANSIMVVYEKEGWYLSLGFDGQITDDTPLADLRKRLKYVALDRLPTPGLTANGWEIRPRTPRSSFKEGVEILDYRNARMTVRVKTEFFALYGRDTTILLPADAGAPEHAYFQIREKFKLDLTLEAPVKFEGGS